MLRGHGEKTHTGRNTLLAAAAVLAAGALVWKKVRTPSWSGRVVLLTGAARGLGFALAQQLAREGCRLVLCAHNPDDLEMARARLAWAGADVVAVPCDVSDQGQVDGLVKEAVARYGRIDVVINNTGIIRGGPIDSMTLTDYEDALTSNFWGVVHTSLAALPAMIERRQGAIVNITPLAGKIGIPHLLPYSYAKFAAVGFSEGLRAELQGKGVQVTTIVPGLMRAGSYVNAMYMGNYAQESEWYSVATSIPARSYGPNRAARQIIRAAKLGTAERILATPANLLARFHGLFPETSNSQLSFSAESGATESKRSMDSHGQFSWPMLDRLTAMGRAAAERLP